MNGPFRTAPSSPAPKLVWRHPTFGENRVNGCQCTDCPGDWTGTGVEVASCRRPCPAWWWRRALCHVFGHRHARDKYNNQVSCMRCLRILETTAMG